MYYNKNIKNLVFDFKSDINYISILVIRLLNFFDCKNKKNSFKDFRKINLIITFLISNEDINILNKFLKKNQMSEEERHILNLMYFKSKIEEETFNIAIIILENKGFISFYKTNKLNSIYLTYSEHLEEFLVDSSLKKYIEVLVNNKDLIYKWNYDNTLNELTKLKGDSI